MEDSAALPESAGGSRRSALLQFLKSIPCSALGFGLDALILVTLVELGRIHYLGANALSFIAGSSIVFVLNLRWVFPRSEASQRSWEYPLFLALAAGGLALNSLFLWILVSGLGIWYLPAKVGAACAVFLYNFACRKYLIFRKRRNATGE